MQNALLEREVSSISQQFGIDVIEGLSQKRKQLHPKYFYDEQGSAYFDEICALDEYYPYQSEIDLLPRVTQELATMLTEDYAVIEFGAGSLQKIKPLLSHVRGVKRFIPIDISGEHLRESCAALQREFPHLKIQAIEGDFTRSTKIGGNIEEKKLGFFPGSTIGNFTPGDAQEFLSNAKKTLGEHSHLLVGVDTKKSPAILHSAYNDSLGVTAKFNLNILDRINRELDADIPVGKFEHYAHYNTTKGCIEMHLVCLEKHSVDIDGVRINFEMGESIHTESSYKYAPSEFRTLALNAGWQVEKMWLASDDLFSMFLLRN
ncbi:MAG: dimethylhistidine N-methyltransferase [Lentisphaeria bacterium]|jgi:dimethylhistidine N-methyltransferase